MADDPEIPPAETSMQRALRMRKAALAAKPQGREGPDTNPRRSSAQPAGASKPWMKK